MRNLQALEPQGRERPASADGAAASGDVQPGAAVGVPAAAGDLPEAPTGWLRGDSSPRELACGAWKSLAEMMTWMEARCVRQDDGCLVWRGSCNGEQPQAGKKLGDRKITINVRRSVWELKTGRLVPRSWVVVCKCGTDGCVAPKCMKAITRSQLLAGKPMKADHKMRLTLSARSRSTTKLTQEAVDDIRHGDGTPEEMAARYGVCANYVKGIKRHRHWKDLSTPFAGLMGVA